MEHATKTATDATNNATKAATNKIKAELSEDEKKVLAFIKAKPQITQKKLQQATGISLRTIKRILPKLQEKGKNTLPFYQNIKKEGIEIYG
ncbi:MAG: winged helix-turn-helix domain-containing protein [Lachnospiraceae bacterium]|nr:winged helix-turn-helix domain-containing protein [Lachnospiraceae bacterium]